MLQEEPQQLSRRLKGGEGRLEFMGGDGDECVAHPDSFLGGKTSSALVFGTPAIVRSRVTLPEPSKCPSASRKAEMTTLAEKREPSWRTRDPSPRSALTAAGLETALGTPCSRSLSV